MFIPEHVKFEDAVGVQSYDGSADIDGSSIDRLGADSAVIVIDVASGAASDVIDFKLQESADGSSWTDVSAYAIAATSGASDNVEVDVDLRGRERYVRLKAVQSDQTVGTTILVHAKVCLGNLDDVPQ